MNLVTIVGARPQFIKAGPVSAALAAAGIHERLLHTGQHYDDAMSARFFAELGLPTPAVNLGVGSGTHGAQTARMLAGIEEHLLAWKPDAMLVYGDTNSTAAGALAAAKLHIPVAHVEAGLRSHNRRMPEEVNRVVTDHLSARLYCPSAESAENLRREGITAGVSIVGDVMHDAVLHYRPRALASSQVLARLCVEPQSYYVATLHRAELTDDPATLLAVFTALSTLGRPVIMPLHPRTRAKLAAAGWREPDVVGLRVIEPLGYLDMLALVASADRVLTDSGGLQKEAFWLDRPCVTLRAETEWVETVTSGWNTLVSPNGANFAERLGSAISRPQPVEKWLLYGDGRAAHRITADLMTVGS